MIMEDYENNMLTTDDPIWSKHRNLYENLSIKDFDLKSLNKLDNVYSLRMRINDYTYDDKICL